MTTHEKPAPPAARLVATLCGTGSCPTVYRAGGDTVLVRGYPVDAGASGVDVTDGEQLVAIPQDLLLEAARLIREQSA